MLTWQKGWRSVRCFRCSARSDRLPDWVYSPGNRRIWTQLEGKRRKIIVCCPYWTQRETTTAADVKSLFSSVEFGFGSNIIHYSFKEIKYQDIWNYVTKRSDDSSPTFIPARERTQLSLYWADWTGVVYIRASLNCTKPRKRKTHDCRQTSGENTEKNVISFRWKSHQKEHAWLHDLPGQLHQSALLQEHLWRQTVLFVFFRSNPLLIKHFRCSVEPPELTLPGWTISWWPFRLYWICISFWKLSWKKNKPHQGQTAETLMISGSGLWMVTQSHPLFHDVVGVVGHFLHDAESSCFRRRGEVKRFVLMTNITHNNVESLGWWIYLVCPYNPPSLLEGSSDNLEKNKRF